MAHQITNVLIVFSTVCSGADQINTLKLRVTGLCEGNSPVTGEFRSQRASDAKMFLFDNVIMFAILIENVTSCGILKNENTTGNKTYMHIFPWFLIYKKWHLDPISYCDAMQL